MKKNTCLPIILFLLSLSVSAQTQKDTIYSNYTKTPVIIDGSDADACWANAKWHAIDQVWIPYNAVMKEGDFEGRFKTAWDENYLYVLVEIRDDSLSDDHSNPLQNWWDDDCLEIFIDEDRSKGNHERNNNAFAYHVSLFYDAIDLDASGSGVNYKDNLSVVMDTIGENLYLWELAIKIYNKDFKMSNPEASRVKLTPNKLMGFTMAYCDNDETTSRENFIGSMYMSEATANDNYKTADYFGTMLLVDNNQDWVSVNQLSSQFNIYPNPAQTAINISNAQNTNMQIFDISGKLLMSKKINSQTESVDVSQLKGGIYNVILETGQKTHNTLLIIK